jgi:hypothetical protein
MKYRTLIVIFLFFAYALHAQQKTILPATKLNGFFKAAIKTIAYDYLGSKKGDIKISSVDKNTIHVELSFSLNEAIQQDDWRIEIVPAFKPTFNWAPHLTPTDRNIIAQHVFRQPALIVSDEDQVLTIIPDVDILNQQRLVEWYMDMDAPKNRLTLGMSHSRVSDHVIFERRAGAVYPPGEIRFGFYLRYFDDKKTVEDPFRQIASFFWTRWGSKLLAEGNPSKGSLEPYVQHTYNWAFKSWEDQVWQQFELNDKQVGAPVFIVNVTQSPDYPGVVDEREFRSIWNQAWFSSLRSASGLFRYAKRTGNEDLMKKALMTKELALSFPKKRGFFYGLVGTEMEKIKIDGKEVHRSKGWNTLFGGNSNRNPYTGDPRKSPFHILDMSWTAYLMLEWYNELEKDNRLLLYARSYADSLIKLQHSDGFFPCWLDLNTLEPLDYLTRSPETAMTVTFLLSLYDLTREQKYKEVALKAMNAVADNIVMQGQWEDFETYWSCSRVGSVYWVGNKIWRNNMYKQNNFSMFWTAQALLKSYHATGNQRYLRLGQRTLDELLMTQASWQPYFIPIKVLGGFGVMNADGEWNDARQSLFAELIIKYGKELKMQEYIERGIAAMRASFTMMYCPENPETKKQWEKRWPFFRQADYGFMMENYGHGGENNEDGLGIGEFTIYDWGNGAASEAYNRLIDHYGEGILKINK